jgi:hypothetical protein
MHFCSVALLPGMFSLLCACCGWSQLSRQYWEFTAAMAPVCVGAQRICCLAAQVDVVGCRCCDADVSDTTG